jgi:hypothetical protein
LPGGLPRHDVIFGVERLPVFIDKGGGHRRFFVVNLLAEIAEDEERTDHNQTEYRP